MGYALIEDGRIIEDDTNLCRIFACPPGEGLTGSWLEALAEAEEVDRLARLLRHAESATNPVRFAFRARRCDGSPVELEVCAFHAAQIGGAHV